MKFFAVLIILCGCVGFSLSQSMCNDMQRTALQGCITSYNNGKNDMSGNSQIRCDASKDFTYCVKGNEDCFDEYNIYSNLQEANMIINSYPCNDVIAGDSVSHLSSLTLLLISFLMFHLL